MNEKRKATLVGSFVLGFFMIVVGTVFTFVQKESLDPSTSIILFFSGELKGLHKGSSVEYRGIKVGKVTDLTLIRDPKTNEIIIPVWFQFLRGVIRDPDETHRVLRQMVREGLRAQLVTSNIVTGELSISLVMKPKSSEMTHGTKYFEIPTLATQTQEVLLRDTLNAAKKSLEDFSDFITSKKLEQMVLSTGNAFDSTNKLVKNVNNRVDPLVVQLSASLTEFQKTAHAFRVLSEYLARHPEALIRGKDN